MKTLVLSLLLGLSSSVTVFAAGNISVIRCTQEQDPSQYLTVKVRSGQPLSIYESSGNVETFLGSNHDAGGGTYFVNYESGGDLYRILLYFKKMRAQVEISSSDGPEDFTYTCRY